MKSWGMGMQARREAARLSELDALRGFAACAVMLYHFIYRYPVPILPKDQLFAKLFGYVIIPEFYLGLLPVYLFFMISGFVISITADQCDTATEFAYRRFSRLYPVYWGAIVIMALGLFLLTDDGAVGPGRFFANFTMVQEYFGIRHISGVFWSLTVELSFYFLVAIAIRFGLMPYRKHVLMLWSVLILLYGFFTVPHPIPWPIVYTLVLDYGHFFVFGISVYELWRAKQRGDGKADSFYLLLILISAVSGWIRYPLAVCGILFVLQALFYLAAVGHLVALRNKILVYLGAISYALYLVHEVLGIIVMELLTLPRALEIIAAIVVCVGVADALTRWVEKPAMRWLRVNRPAWIPVATSPVR